MYFALIITVVQITLGTEVREQIDVISSAMNNLNRGSWVGKVGNSFLFHRDVAILVIIVNLISFVLIRKRYVAGKYQYKYISCVLLLIAAQIITGLFLSYLGLPPVAQALHILLATMLFGSQFYLLLLLSSKQKDIVKQNI